MICLVAVKEGRIDLNQLICDQKRLHHYRENRHQFQYRHHQALRHKPRHRVHHLERQHQNQLKNRHRYRLHHHRRHLNESQHQNLEHHHPFM